MKLPQFVPFGRLNEYRAHPEAHRIAYTVPSGVFGEYRLKLYKSREAMAPFLKGSHHALVKDPVHPNLLTNRNLQRPL